MVTIKMFEQFKKKIGLKKDQESLKETILSDIEELGDIGVECAIKKQRIPTEMAIHRLDQIRIKGIDTPDISNTASKQIDRIRDVIDW